MISLSLEIDEILLARLQRLSRLRQAPTSSGIELHEFATLGLREPNMTSSSVMKNPRWAGFDNVQIVAITLAGLFYGGLHALSWNSAALQTSAETLLWKISCFSIIGTGPVVILTWLVFGEYYKNVVGKDLTRLFGEEVTTWLSLLPKAALVTLLPSTILLYVFSRVFLIVEVFLSLPHADPAVYDTPN